MWNEFQCRTSFTPNYRRNVVNEFVKKKKKRKKPVCCRTAAGRRPLRWVIAPCARGIKRASRVCATRHNPVAPFQFSSFNHQLDTHLRLKELFSLHYAAFVMYNVSAFEKAQHSFQEWDVLLTQTCACFSALRNSLTNRSILYEFCKRNFSLLVFGMSAAKPPYLHRLRRCCSVMATRMSWQLA